MGKKRDEEKVPRKQGKQKTYKKDNSGLTMAEKLYFNKNMPLAVLLKKANRILPRQYSSVAVK